ncbi:MAG: tetratricopeptide repeat protein [Bacteriovoracaceae bacterium]|nr:tetratricopeptide repeat protein [Bacteriovoracaceae bacterium]
MKYILFPIMLLALTSCLKTTEEIKREQNMSAQLEQTQKFSADFLVKVRDMESKVDQFNGRLEDIEHQQGKQNAENQENQKKTMEKMEEQLEALKKLSETNRKNLETLKNELDEQKKYLERVTKSLSSLGSEPAKKKDQEPSSELKTADDFFARKRYKQAKPIYEQLLAGNTLSSGKINSVQLNLGIIDYHYKNYNEALVYFSKIYTNFPQSSKAPSALYHIGMCFKALGQNAEAKETFNEVIAKYSNTNFAKLAKDEIKN